MRGSDEARPAAGTVRGVLRVLFLTTAALVAAVVLYTAFTLPAATTPMPAIDASRVSFGAYHVHTQRSDGSGTLDDVARAAAAAGLQFVIVTDHGDGTRAPEPPAYRHDVLVIDAVEIGSDEGHVVALGLRNASDYPLGGRASDVIEDVHRLGGWAVAAHPDSPKPGLQWRAAAAPYDALEWINADSEWRDEPLSRLLAAAARATVRGPESVASLFGDPARSLRRWDAAAQLRPVAGLAAVDAHARLGVDDGEYDSPGEGTLLRVPSYRVMFRTLVQAVEVDAPVSGDASADAEHLLSALRRGRTFSVVRAAAWPAALSFTASANAGGGVVFEPGDRLPAGVPVTFHASAGSGAPGVGTVRLVGNGQTLGEGEGALTHALPVVAAGAYRVEVWRPGLAVPWLVSSPIYAGDPTAASRGAGAATDVVALTQGSAWTIEKDARSTGALATAEEGLRFDYGLGEGAPSGQYAALAARVDADAAVDRVQFVVRSDRPMRVSVQLRQPGGPDARWRRSVFVGREPRQIVVPLTEFQPVVVETSGVRPASFRVADLLFVVDTVNTAPGSRGTLWLSDVSLGRAAVPGGGS
jgi:hypothetical protein